MPYRDSEFYKSVGDGSPTAEPDHGAEEYARGEEWESRAGDALPTREVEELEYTVSESKKKSGARKAVKMLKLTAAAVVTSVVAVGAFSAGSGVRGSYSEPRQEWPSITYSTDEVEDSAYTTVYSNHARQAHNVQFTVDGSAYRLEDPSESIFFMWSNSMNDEARLLVHDRYAGNSYTVVISGSPFSADRRDPDNAYGTISSTTGDVFYIEAVSHFYKKNGAKINTKDELADLMHQLVVRSHITAAYDGGWGKLLIGDKLYSDLNASWSGLDSCMHKDADYFVSFDCTYNSRSTVELTDLVGTVEVNGISWSVYRQYGFLPDEEENGDGFDMLWFSPDIEGENCVLGLRDHMISEYFLYALKMDHGLDLNNVTPETLSALAEGLLKYYHAITDAWRW